MEYHPMLKSIVNKFNNEYEQDVVMNLTFNGWRSLPTTKHKFINLKISLI